MRESSEPVLFRGWFRKRARRGSLGVAMILAGLLGFCDILCAPAQTTKELEARVKSLEENVSHMEARLARQMDELLWMQKLDALAEVDKVSFTGPSPRGTGGLAGSNMVVVSALTFLPKNRSSFRKVPLIVLAHGEIHGNTASYEDRQVIVELIEQGYAIVAPDYRGSAGYGADFWKQIDYGGLEIEDVHAAREFMIEQHKDIDPKRVGMIGWSHGGLIALMNVFDHPDGYAVCYAGVPVSDLEERIRIRGKDYEHLFSAPYHIGKTVAEAPEEYRKRSPAGQAGKLRTPLLIQANTNDDDVTTREITKLIDALHATHKDQEFQYHLYTNAPGGHLFNRLDTRLAQDSRKEIWRFLARYLKPPHPPKD